MVSPLYYFSFLPLGFLINFGATSFGNFGFFLTPHEIVTDGLLLSTGAEKNSSN